MPSNHASPEPPPRPAPLHALLLLAILAVAAFANTVRHDFAFDDRGFIEGTWLERHGESPTLAFTSGSMEGSAHWGVSGYYRPVVTLSMVADFSIWGRDSRGYHLTNLLLHLACTLLAYGVLGGIFRGGALAFAAAALFAVHPVHSESVAFVSGRTDVLYTLFLLASTLGFDAAPASWRPRLVLAGSLLAFALALLSKETAACLPLVLAAILWTDPDRRPRAWLRLLPHALLLGAYLVLRLSILPAAGVVTSYSTPGADLTTRLVTMIPVAWGYVKTALVPVPLAVDRAWTWETGFPIEVDVLSRGGLLLLAAGLWVLRRERAAMLGVAWFVLPLLPVSNLLPTGTIQADRYLYLPVLGSCLFLAWAATRGGRRTRQLGTVCLLIVGSLYLVRTVDRNRDWKDDLTLWAANVRDYPEAPLAILNLGATHGEAGNHFEAARLFRWAFARGIGSPMLAYNLGFAVEQFAAESTDLDERLRLQIEAESAYRACLQRYEYPPARERLGFLLIALNREEDGLRELRRALPASQAAYLELADRASAVGDAAEEHRLLDELGQHHPYNWEGAVRLAQIEAERGEKARAAAAYQRVLQAPGVDPLIRRMALDALLALEPPPGGD